MSAITSLIQSAFRDFDAADVAWMAELQRLIDAKLLRGRRGDLRYTAAGIGDPGSQLRALHDAWVEAGNRWRILWHSTH